jgi:hypothetical protein
MKAAYYSIEELKNTLAVTIGPGELMDTIIADLERKDTIREGTISVYVPMGDVVHHYHDQTGKTNEEVPAGELLRIIKPSTGGLCHAKAANGSDVYANLQHFTKANHKQEKEYLYAMISSLRSLCSPIINYFALTEFYETIKDADTKQQMADILDKEELVAKAMAKKIKKLF